MQAEGCHSYVGTLLSSCNLYNLYITYSSNGNIYPISLDSWHPAIPCSLRKLRMEGCPIYKVPHWMASLGNLVVLKLHAIIYFRPEDVDILGAIPSLLFLKLGTIGRHQRKDRCPWQKRIHKSEIFLPKYYRLRDCTGVSSGINAKA